MILLIPPAPDCSRTRFQYHKIKNSSCCFLGQTSTSIYIASDAYVISNWFADTRDVKVHTNKISISQNPPCCFLRRAPIRWYSKRQSTVESATYGSELVATRIAVEGAIDLRYKLRMMGIGVKKSTILCIDNKSVVYNSSFPSSTLKKKHNSVAYHKCREAVAAGIVRTAHIDGHWNVSDILTKPKGEADYYRLLRNIMYRRQET